MMTEMDQNGVLLKVNDLKKHFPIRKGFFSRVVGQVKAVDGVSFYLKEGEIVGLVGESGCGKTTTGRVVLRAYEPSHGQILFHDRDMGMIDLATLPPKRLKAVWRNIQMIFQDPYSSLNPRKTLLQIVGDPLRNYGMASGEALKDRVADLLRSVGLRP